MKESKKVVYDPNTMWFDYQSLFNKMKDDYLDKENDNEIDHIDFIENDIARDAVFGTDWETGINYSKTYLNEILIGNAYSLFFAKKYCYEQLNKINSNNNSDEIMQCKLNYIYFLALLVPFINNGYLMEEYSKLSNGNIPTSLKKDTRNINEMNLYEIVTPLIEIL